jgi:hypothetical protein
MEGLAARKGGLLTRELEGSLAWEGGTRPLKRGRPSKKESLICKKLLKSTQREGQLQKHRSDEDNSATTHESSAGNPATALVATRLPQPSLLSRLLARPPYLSLRGSRVSGDFGHGSAILRRPLVEGSFYLEVVVREESLGARTTAEGAAVRVGVCHAGFSPSFPLGCEESIAYKSVDGSFVRGGE